MIVMAALPRPSFGDYGVSDPRILVTYFPQCAASVLGLNLMRAPLLPRWHCDCPTWPESSDSGHFPLVMAIVNFDTGRSVLLFHLPPTI